MIIVMSCIIIGIVFALVMTLTNGLVTVWYDVWKVICLGLGGYVGGYVAYVLLAWLITLFSSGSKRVERPEKFFMWNTRQVAQVVRFHCGVRMHVSGLEKLPTYTRFLLISNHRSNLDPILAYEALFDYEVAFISKPANLKLPMVGRFLHKCCCLPIDRENARNAMKTIIEAADYIKSGAVSMAIYPEGTRSRSRKMGEFHAGSFKIAQKADAPLVISAISGTERVGRRFPRKTDVYYDIIDVIPAEEVKAEKTVELAERARAMIAEHLARVEDDNGK